MTAEHKDHKIMEAKTFEAIKRVRTYSGVELKGKELGQQLGVRWLA